MKGNKMSVTINNMELIRADELEASSLEVGDLIGYDEDIVEVTAIESDSTGDNYYLELTNDFGETEIIQFAFDELVDWYVYLD
jgi:hypothetical protein